MTTRVKLNVEQPGTKTISSVHEDRGFHSKTFGPYTHEVKDSAESRKFKPVYQVGSLPLPPMKLSRCSSSGLRILRQRAVHHY